MLRVEVAGACFDGLPVSNETDKSEYLGAGNCKADPKQTAAACQIEFSGGTAVLVDPAVVIWLAGDIGNNLERHWCSLQVIWYFLSPYSLLALERILVVSKRCSVFEIV